jgi:hypothetical protein
LTDINQVEQPLASDPMDAHEAVINSHETEIAYLHDKVNFLGAALARVFAHLDPTNSSRTLHPVDSDGERL